MILIFTLLCLALHSNNYFCINFRTINRKMPMKKYLISLGELGEIIMILVVFLVVFELHLTYYMLVQLNSFHSF